MLKRLKGLFQKPQALPTADEERSLTLDRDIQTLRLELSERDQQITNLKQELERQRTSENTRISAAVQTQIEQLLTDTAAPVTQLLTQTHLLEVEGKPIQAKDVLAVAKRLIRTLEDNGLTLNCSVGETVPFDPNYHDALSTSASLTPGTTVAVKFAGISYQGKVIRKAGVAPCQDA
ncbi:MAG TPA: nucleotide exchange factor GrpE [Cyanobacteria bacterium UBA11371]|nr:nucleotide exchange factor GrpE [Cyanobacteria bacterium UBA11371]HBE36777.1 nucleotide exchange factor GrpE [Cyanobacteria bacterium UBA11368]